MAKLREYILFCKKILIAIFKCFCWDLWNLFIFFFCMFLHFQFLFVFLDFLDFGMNDKGVCITAPGIPGLFKRITKSSLFWPHKSQCQTLYSYQNTLKCCVAHANLNLKKTILINIVNTLLLRLIGGLQST